MRRFLALLGLALACTPGPPRPPVVDTTVVARPDVEPAPDSTFDSTASTFQPDSMGADTLEIARQLRRFALARRPTPDTAAPAPAMPTATGAGLPFGAYRIMVALSNPAPFTLGSEMNTPSTIAARIAYARSKGMRLILQMTGGPHTAANRGCCLSVINGVLKFDRAKWNARMATFNTTSIKSAIANGVADGTIVGANVMDEPNACSSGSGNTWGPCGTMTKARVDSLCAEVQRIFPTLPAGVAHQVLAFERTKDYRVCQFIMGGVRTRSGTLAQYVAGRDSALALGARGHHAILFNMNVLNGGTRDTDGNWTCNGAGQGGLGTYKPLCRMTTTQLRERGLLLGPAGCGLIIWTYDYNYWHYSTVLTVFRDIAAKMAATPIKPCRRF